MCHITLNKTAIFGDNGTISPGGVRIGKHTNWSSRRFHIYIGFVLNFFFNQ